MARRQRDDVACWICDYGWIVLFAFLIIITAVLLRPIWMPSPNVTPTLSPAPILTADPPAIVTALDEWLHMEGTGYSLDYPPDWFAYHSPDDLRDPSGIVYDLLLSNASGNESPQESTADETTRITIWYVPKPAEATPLWIAQRWAWLGTSLDTGELNGVQVWFAQPESIENMQQKFYWVEWAENLYTIEVYFKAEDRNAPSIVDKILSTIEFN